MTSPSPRAVPTLRGSSFWTPRGPKSDVEISLAFLARKKRAAQHYAEFRATSHITTVTATATTITQTLMRALQISEVKNRVFDSDRRGIRLAVMQRNTSVALRKAAVVVAENERIRLAEEKERLGRPVTTTAVSTAPSHCQAIKEEKGSDGDDESSGDDDIKTACQCSLPRTYGYAFGREDSMLPETPGDERRCCNANMDVDTRKDSFSCTIEVIPLPGTLKVVFSKLRPVDAASSSNSSSNRTPAVTPIGSAGLGPWPVDTASLSNVSNNSPTSALTPIGSTGL